MPIPEEKIQMLQEIYFKGVAPSYLETAFVAEPMQEIAASMVSTIRKQADYERFANLAAKEGMNVADWISYCSLKQALSLRHARIALSTSFNTEE